jgi:hypothetical protein
MGPPEVSADAGEKEYASRVGALRSDPLSSILPVSRATMAASRIFMPEIGALHRSL